MKRITRIQIVLLSAIAALLTGCNSFNRQWNELGEYPVQYTDATGRWEGTWSCEQTGHSGQLWCMVSQVEPERYELFFRAEWAKIFRGNYTLYVTPKQAEGSGESDHSDHADGTLHFKGETKIAGFLGGMYTFDGTITPTRFETDYTGPGNEGVFVLERPE